MGLFTFLLLRDAVSEIKRHNLTMERAALTPAERAAEDAERAAEDAKLAAEDKAHAVHEARVEAIVLRIIIVCVLLMGLVLGVMYLSGSLH
jgi:hypothetical protein